MAKAAYKRVLLKLSGEALQGERDYGISPPYVEAMAQELCEVQKLGAQLAIVVGGGNIFRGMSASAKGMDRAVADYLGMLATIMNAVALQDAMEKAGAPSRVLTAIEVQQVAEPYIRRRAIRHLEKGRVVIFAGGTGNPYFTTDTAASLRANEIHADIIFKGTKVDGIYDKDPMQHSDAKLFSEITYLDVLRKDLKVMDATAISMCKENNIPIRVFNMNERGNIHKAVCGEALGTIVTKGT